MPPSRRTVLRDAALLTAGLAASPLAKIALGSETPGFIGFRVVFAGAWLFCDDRKGGMLAISRDMANNGGQGSMDIPHIFPFGVWNQRNFNRVNPSLSENPRNTKGETIPYRLTCGAYSAPPSTSLTFGNALNKARGRFNYILNSDRSVKVDLTRKRLRVIALPVPAKIVPAGFRIGASLTDVPGKLLAKRDVSMPPVDDEGVATAHIFEYPGAASLVFETPSDSLTVPAGQHLHFRAAPGIALSHDALMTHGPQMFRNLIDVLYRVDSKQKREHFGDQQLTYSDSAPLVKAIRGKDAEGLGLSEDELDFAPDQSAHNVSAKPRLIEAAFSSFFNSDVASCTPGGLGVG